VSFPAHCNISTEPFAIVHSDVWGPSLVVSLSVFRWFVIFIDDYSYITWVYLLKDKGDVSSCFRHSIK
jgi:hypothetical protein